MKFYTQQRQYYCDIDLHARKMYVCILDQKAKTKVHENIKTDPETFFELVFAFIEDVIVGAECVLCWYCRLIFAPSTTSPLYLVMHYT